MNYPYCTLSELYKMGLRTENSMIERIDINLIGHFGNIVTVELIGRHARILRDWNATKCLGVVLQCLWDLFELTKEDGKMLSEVVNVPCRIVFDNKTNLVVGIGHFMEDKFIMFDDLFNHSSNKAKELFQ